MAKEPQNGPLVDAIAIRRDVRSYGLVHNSVLARSYLVLRLEGRDAHRLGSRDCFYHCRSLRLDVRNL